MNAAERPESAVTAENVESRIRAVERLGQHGSMPDYWRTPLVLAFSADEVAAADLLAELVRTREALAAIEPKQQHALSIIERNGFVFEDIGREPGNWQHLAFTLYMELCEIDSIVRAALDIDFPGAAAGSVGETRDG